MKNRKKLISGCLLGIVGIACLRYIVKNEKDKKYPVERYWDEQEEKQQNTSGDDTQTDCDAEEKDVTHSVTIDNITYEFVDCDMIEDTEIEMQTRYPAEFLLTVHFLMQIIRRICYGIMRKCMRKSLNWRI